MDDSEILHLRSSAMIDFEEGRLPESESKLSELASKIGALHTPHMKYELCQVFINRATVRRFANRFPDALTDLDAAEKILQEFPKILGQQNLTLIYLIRAKILATPFSRVYDREASIKCLTRVREFGWMEWAVDELESDLAFRVGDWKRAAMLASRAAETVASEGWEEGVAFLQRRAGIAYLELGKLEQAEVELKKAQIFFERLGPPDGLAETQLGLARLRSRLGQHDVAWDFTFKAINGIESLIRYFREPFDQQRFIIDKSRYYEHAFDIAMAKGGVEGVQRAWTVAERAKSFYLCNLVANANIPLFDGIDPSVIKRLRDLEVQLDNIEQALKRTQAPDETRKNEMENQFELRSRERQSLLSEIMKENPRWAALRVPPQFDIGNELKKLDTKWVAISYFWRESRESEGANLFIFYAKSNSAPQYTQVYWSKEDLAALDSCKEALRGVPPIWASIFPDELINKVLPKEIREFLSDGLRLIISPHGRLRSIPLHAIDFGEGDFLINHWQGQYIPTLALLPMQRHDTHTNGVMLVGSPEAFHYPKLEEVEGEINELYQMWSVKRPQWVRRLMISASSSPEKEGLPLDTWYKFEILHFACHGEFPEGRPFDTALLLGTNAIRGSEIFAVRLNAKLMIFSACSLGRQADKYEGVEIVGDEWLGLFIPLFYAGAENLIVSLWDANSEVAASFMKTLHQSLTEGKPAVSAFQQASKAMSSKPASRWANWYLVGFPISGNDKVD